MTILIAISFAAAAVMIALSVMLGAGSNEGDVAAAHRWLPQTTCADCAAGSSGDLPPPSPPAEQATARQDQARQPGTCDGAEVERKRRRREPPELV
jgi:hypothetical protein